MVTIKLAKVGYVSTAIRQRLQTESMEWHPQVYRPVELSIEDK